MYRFLLLLLAGLTLAGNPAWSQSTGDIAFVGVNADGNDDIALVALEDIAANTTLFLRDDEWNGTSFIDGNEAIVTWNSGSSLIPKGRIITFSNFGSTAMTANFGSLSTTSTNLGIGNGDEAIFIYSGAANAPTTFITALGKGAEAAAFGTLNGTGLSIGSSAIFFPAGIDVAAYKGARTGLEKIGFISQLNQTGSNWDTEDGSGDQHNNGVVPDVPFSTTPFLFGNNDASPPQIISVAVKSINSLEVRFDEVVNTTSATNAANYRLTPLREITGVTLGTDGKTAILTTENLVQGKNYSLTINNISDVAVPPNLMATAYAKDGLFFNDYAGSDVIFSEIMYNPGSGGDSLEFVELHNRGNVSVSLGGLMLANGIIGVLPEHSLAPNSLVCIALDSSAARRFYGISFYQWSADALGNGGEAISLRNPNGTLLDTVNYDDAAPWPLSPDGTGPSLEIVSPISDNNVATNWRASSTNTGKSYNANQVYASPGFLPNSSLPAISFKPIVQWINESRDTVSIAIELTGTNAFGVSFRLEATSFGTASTGDYTFTGKDTAFAAGGTGVINIKVPVINDANPEGDEYAVLRITNINGATLINGEYHTIHIIDNDLQVPLPTEALKLQLLSSYKNGAPNSNSAEIVAYDSSSKRLFVVNSIAGKINLVNFTNPSAPSLYKTIDISTLGGINSIAIRGGVIAAAIENLDKTQPGYIVFLDTSGNIIKQLTAGILPDMVGISPDGRYVVTANEGEPVATYLQDPEGSVTVVDISGGIVSLTQASVTTIGLAELNSIKAALKESGVRLFGRAGNIANGSTVSQDLEPEYVAFSPDSKLAYVTLQENNAIMVIDLERKLIAQKAGKPFVQALGLKNHQVFGNGLDASNVADSINISRWPVKGMYMPDAIASYRGLDHKAYYLIANEGDAREYSALTEEVTIRDLKLDAVAFPDSVLLRNSGNLGNLSISSQTGDVDSDGDFDELHVFGGRSFSILDSLGNQVWDSGDQFEQILKSRYRQFFNTNNTGDAIKNRSDNKGPEPEGVNVAEVGGKIYAFITLERPGGVMVYDVTNPISPQFVTFAINRTIPLNLNEDDMGPEGVLFIPSNESPNKRSLLLLANEISSSISVFEVVDQSPLPIALTQFSGVLVGNDALLQWQTADQGSLSRIDIQYSIDGRGFSTIGSLAAGGTNYQFHHANVPAARIFYRLALQEKDGGNMYSRIVVLDNSSKKTFVKGLMQNPIISNVVTPLINSATSQSANAVITDMTGRVLSKAVRHIAAGENVWSIPAGNLPNGVYALTIKTDDGVNKVIRFLKR